MGTDGIGMLKYRNPDLRWPRHYGFPALTMPTLQAD